MIARIKLWRLNSVIKYSKIDSLVLSREFKKSRMDLFLSMVFAYIKYGIWTNQYKREQFWNLSSEEKELVSKKYKPANNSQDRWISDRFENIGFLNKWMDFKWQTSFSKRSKRVKAYTTQYNMGSNCYIEQGVTILCVHSGKGKLTIGDNVLLARDVDIDYTGDLTIKDNVSITFGATIETHTHPTFMSPDAPKHLTEEIPKVIEEGVIIGAKALITSSCKKIGRYSRIAAGAVVRNDVPPYAIVVGNPAKIVGFVYTPEEVIKFEENKYEESEKTDQKRYEFMYNKFFIQRIAFIKDFLKN